MPVIIKIKKANISTKDNIEKVKIMKAQLF